MVRRAGQLARRVFDTRLRLSDACRRRVIPSMSRDSKTGVRARKQVLLHILATTIHYYTHTLRR